MQSAQFVIGSIRIPAICCGTYGFKPTVGRVPYGAQRGCSDPGLKFIKACAGPLTNDFEALELFAKAAIGAEPAKYDSTALDIPWRSLSLDPKQKLRLGVLAEDPNYPWHPPVRAIISKATQKLKERGYELVRLDPAECHISDANEIAWGLFSLDQTAAGIVSSAQEPDIPSRIRIKSDFAKVKASFAPEARELEGLAKLSLLSRKRAEILENWRKLWNRHQLDAVIGPGAQNTAVEHDMYGVPPYTTFLNLLDVRTALRIWIWRRQLIHIRSTRHALFLSAKRKSSQIRLSKSSPIKLGRTVRLYCSHQKTLLTPFQTTLPSSAECPAQFRSSHPRCGMKNVYSTLNLWINV